jgi:uncharacterized membrane protein
MNYKLIFNLSLFGLAMAIGTVFFIPTMVEPFCWLIIFLVCAYIIAKKAPGKYFLHGLLVSIANSIWITAFHVIFYETYMANHPEMVSMSANMPMQDHPKLMMIISGPLFGVASGLVLGLFSFIAARIIHKKSNLKTS